MEIFRLADVKRVSPRLCKTTGKEVIDIDTVRAVVGNRFHVLKLYGNKVIKPVIQEASQKADRMGQTLLQRTRKLMIREDIQLGMKAQETINKALAQYRTLATVYQFKQQLKGIWIRTSNSHASRVQRLQTWCTEAEQTGIRALEEFAQYLRAYGLREV